MFSADPATVRSGQRSICVVAGERGPLTWHQVMSWRQKGHAIHVLWCDLSLQAPQQLLQCGITVSLLDSLKGPGPLQVPNVHGACPSERSDRVRYALEQLHERQHFDLIVFPALGGLGFRVIQARQCGLSLQGVPLAVCLDICSSSIRAAQERWPDGLDDLQVDFLERRAFEQADVQLAPCPRVLEHVRKCGWAVRADCIHADLDEALRYLPPVASSPHDDPLVTVCVPHFNLGVHLPRTLESLASQTYVPVEVLVIDDGSTDPGSRSVFQLMQERYPQFRFLTQSNAGIGATRNRGLAEARGSYFIPMDADNVASPELVERLVRGIQHRPELGVLTCYFLAFEEDANLDRRVFRYAYRPTGGPRVLASMRNVYGDATGIYRTDAFRAVGGYETDRGTSFEDWEAFVKLVQAGYEIDVLPEHLFYYRHRATGFSRVTKQFANHERVLRQFRQMEELPAVERMALWNALVGFHRRMDYLAARERSLRYRVADRVHAACERVPVVKRALKWLLRG